MTCAVGLRQNHPDSILTVEKIFFLNVIMVMQHFFMLI